MKANRKNENFWQFFEGRIAIIENEGRWGTASNYRKTRNSFKHFVGEVPLSLADITPELIQKYNRQLYNRGLIRNSVSQYNRVLRAVYNEAVNQGLIPDIRPFKNVYTGIDRTMKRALPEKELSKIATLKTERKALEMARDLFLFSYATCGMTFVDMTYLRKKDIVGDNIIYYRRKTGSRIQVKIEPMASNIIEKYSLQTRGSQYVFPILGRLTGKDAYRRFTSALTEYNRALKKLSLLSCTSNVSSYVPRHSWATAARNNGADISTVSEALGHQSEKTTRIYLAGFDRRKIEMVNKALVDHLLLFGSPRAQGQ